MSTMCYLIVSETSDPLALAVYALLQRRHGADARFVSVEALLRAPALRHVVDGSEVHTHIRLGDGSVVDFDDVAVIFNRVGVMRAPNFALADPVDHDYALAELHALWLSCLAGAPCPVLNRATPRGLGSPWIGPFEWLVRSARCGLPTRRVQVTTDGPESDLEPVGAELHVVVAGDRVVDAPQGVDEDALLCLSASVACPLLQVTFGRFGASGAWCVSGASGFVERWDDTVVSAVADALEAEALS